MGVGESVSACEHKNTKKGKLVRTFKGAAFEVDGLVCQDCGAGLWTDELSKHFHKWVMSQKKQRIQYQMTPEAKECLDRFISEELPNAKPATLSKVLVLEQKI